MIRSILLSTILLILLGFVQSTWLGAIAILGITPDLGLLALVWISYKNGLVEGPVSGFFSGLAEDAISAAPLGFNAFVKTIIAWAASALHGSFYIDRLLLPILLGLAATIIKALSTIALSFLFEDKVQAYDLFGRVLWIEAGYNALLAPLMFLLLAPLKRLLVTETARV